MIFTVAVSTPSFLDSIFGREVSKFDFRSEGYGIIQLHGPIYFKWEMCTRNMLLIECRDKEVLTRILRVHSQN